VRKAWILFAVALALTVAVEPLVAHESVFAVEAVFAWNALFGFGACAALILVAKALGVLLKRRDDYYD
jgi:hypothetical protein